MLRARRLVLLFLFVASSSAMAMAQEKSYVPKNDSDWKTVDPASAGLKPGSVESAIEFAFKNNTSSVVVLFEGKVVAEKHLQTDSREMNQLKLGRMQTGGTSQKHSVEDVASVQKSIASVLAGIAIEKKLVRLSDPVSKYLGKGWSRATEDEEGQILIMNLVSMTSGLTPRLAYEAEPGKQWRYNTSAYAQVSKVLEAATRSDLNSLSKKWLFNPLGMKDSKWTKRPTLIRNSSGNPYGFATSARDLARFGLLVMRKGNWDGKKVYSYSGYFKKMTRPSQKINPAYGYLWWINGQDFYLRPGVSRKIKGSRLPDAPEDLFDAAGALGRRLFIIPSRQLIVVRIGARPTARSFDNEFWKRLLEE